MDKNKTAMERFRPEAALGGTVEGLSLPQHAVIKDAEAEQKQKVKAVVMQLTMDVYRTSTVSYTHLTLPTILLV